MDDPTFKAHDPNELRSYCLKGGLSHNFFLCFVIIRTYAEPNSNWVWRSL